jgi:PAS domain-containing protein
MSPRPTGQHAPRRGDSGTITGVTPVSVRFVTGEPATFFLFSVAELYGADILVVVSERGTDISAAVCGPPAPPPRFCRVLRDQAGRIIEIDEFAPLVLGWPAQGLLQGDPPMSRVHVDDHGRVIDNWMSMLAGGANGHRCRARLGRPDGTWVWLEITNFNHLEDSDNPSIVSEMLDISDEMAAHEAVREREQHLHRLAEALPLGVIQLADDRRIVYKNDCLNAILGNPMASTVDDQFAATLAEDRSRLYAAIDDALESGSDHDLTIRVRQDGPESERLVQVITKALRHDNGAVCGVIPRHARPANRRPTPPPQEGAPPPRRSPRQTRATPPLAGQPTTPTPPSNPATPPKQQPSPGGTTNPATTGQTKTPALPSPHDPTKVNYSRTAPTNEIGVDPEYAGEHVNAPHTTAGLALIETRWDRIPDDHWIGLPTSDC